ncbi:hypothetical protein K437DRAFT_270975, partial [Tilletiaria anomala UBC 951]
EEEAAAVAASPSSAASARLSPAAAHAHVARTVAEAVAARFGPSAAAHSGSGSPSPRAIPDSPLPARAGLNMPRKAATLQAATAIDSPLARSKPIYIPPGRQGFRSGQLRGSRDQQQHAFDNVPHSATIERTAERQEASKMMLTRLGQRSASPLTPKSAF